MKSNIFLRKYQVKELSSALEIDLKLIEQIINLLDEINGSDNEELNAKKLQEVSRIANEISVANRWNYLAKIGIPWEVLIFLNQSKSSQDYDIKMCHNMKENKEISALMDCFKKAHEITTSKMVELKEEQHLIFDQYMPQLVGLKKHSVMLEKKMLILSTELLEQQSTYRYGEKEFALLNELESSLIKMSKLQDKELVNYQALMKDIVIALKNFPFHKDDIEKYSKLGDFFAKKAEIKFPKVSNVTEAMSKIKEIKDNVGKIPKEKNIIEILSDLKSQLSNINNVVIKVVNNIESTKDALENDMAILRDIRKLLDDYNKLKNDLMNEKYQSEWGYCEKALAQMDKDLFETLKIVINNITSIKHNGILSKLQQFKPQTQFIESVSKFVENLKIAVEKDDYLHFSKFLSEDPIDLQMALATFNDKEMLNVIKRDIASVSSMLMACIKNDIRDPQQLATLLFKLNLSIKHCNSIFDVKDNVALFDLIPQFLKKYSEVDELNHKILFSMLADLWQTEMIISGKPSDANVINALSRELSAYLKTVEEILAGNSKMDIKDAQNYFNEKITYIKSNFAFPEQDIYYKIFDEILLNINNVTKSNEISKIREQIKKDESKQRDLLIKSWDKKPEKVTSLELPIEITKIDDAISGLKQCTAIFCGGPEEKDNPSSDVSLINEVMVSHLERAQKFIELCEKHEGEFDTESNYYKTYEALKNAVTFFIKNYSALIEDYMQLKKAKIYEDIQKFYSSAFEASSKLNLLQVKMVDFNKLKLEDVVKHYRNKKNWISEEEYEKSGIVGIIENLELAIMQFKIPEVREKIIYTDNRKAKPNTSHTSNQETLFRKLIVDDIVQRTKLWLRGDIGLVMQEFNSRLLNFEDYLNEFYKKIESTNLHDYVLNIDGTDPLKEFKTIIHQDFIKQHLGYSLSLFNECMKFTKHLKENTTEGMLERMMVLRLIEIYGELSKIFSSYIKDFPKFPIAKLRNDLYHLGMELFAGYYVLQSFINHDEIKNLGGHKSDEFTICIDRTRQAIQEMHRFKTCLDASSDIHPIVPTLAGQFAVTYFGQIIHLIQQEPVFLQEASLLESSEKENSFSLIKALSNIRLARGELAHQLQTIITQYNELTLFEVKDEVIKLEKEFNLKIPLIKDSTFITKDCLAFMQLSWVMLKAGHLAFDETNIAFTRCIIDNFDEFEKIFNLDKGKSENIYQRVDRIIEQIDKCALTCRMILNLPLSNIKIEKEKSKDIEFSFDFKHNEGLESFKSLVKDLHDQKSVSYSDYRSYKGKSNSKWDGIDKKSKTDFSFSFEEYNDEPKILIGETPDYIITFAEHSVSGSGGNCGFINLGIDRDKAIEQLLKNSGDEFVRSLVAPEIEAAFVEGTLPSMMLNTQLAQELHELNIKCDEKKALHMGEIKEFLYKENLLEKNDGLNYEQLLQFLLEQSKNNELHETEKEKYLQQYIKLNQFHGEVTSKLTEKLKEFINDKDTFENFVKEYLGKGGWLSYNRHINLQTSTSSIDAIAYINKIAVNIWQVGKEGQLECIHSFPPPELKDKIDTENKVDMLHTNGLTHFNFLETKSVVDKKSTISLSNK